MSKPNQRDPEIQAVIDKQAIYDVLMRYCRAVDRLDEKLLRSVYSENAWDNHGTFDGPASEFIPWVMRIQEETFDNSTHSISNVYIELAGDVAFVESYFTGFHRFHRGDEHFTRLSCGRYIDRFERGQNRWEIADRLVVNDWGRVDKVQEEVRLLIPGSRSREDPVYTHRLRSPAREGKRVVAPGVIAVS